MSNNRSAPNPSSFPFLVVEYENKKAIIGRNANYQETLASIKEGFGALRNTPNEDIGINARIEEVDDSCRITGGVWSDLLPRLTVVQVVPDPATQSSKPKEQLSEPTKSEEQTNTTATINVHRRSGWDRSVTQMYTTRIPLDHTFGQLIEQIKQQEGIAGTYTEFRYDDRYPSVDETLAQRNLTSNSLVELVMK